MIRSLSFVASLLLVCAVPARAQTHSHTGSSTQHHAAGHVRPDSAHHAAMHALTSGTWSGTVTSPEGTSNAFELTVAHDGTRGMSLRTGAGQIVPPATISNLAIHGTRLQWTQHLSGASCKATALISPATPLDRETIKGKMTCADGEMTFVLLKTAG